MSAPLVIPYFIPHQGCPHQCVFCNQSIITGRRGRIDLDEIETLIQEYLSFKGQRRRVEFAFFGGNFLGLPRERQIDLLDRVKPWVDRGAIQSIRCSTRPDTVSRETLDLVQPYGLDLVELGVQSMDNRVLEQAERGHTREDTLAAVRVLRERKMKIGVQVMVGLPGDTRASVLETAGVLAGLKPDLARIYPLLVLAGSKLARWYASGAYLPLSLEQAVVQVKAMLEIFNGAGVPVIRMGLQAGEMMEDPGQMLAGPWHPAFGHLVHSALMLDRACNAVDTLIREGRGAGSIQLRVHPKSLSRLQGNKKGNFEKLAARYPGLVLGFSTDASLAPDEITAAFA
ncbi:MAG: radical SAM protein [Desulfobacter sp.]|nr:MAG: radical SAM protein [Desulfobacter sp.]